MGWQTVSTALFNKTERMLKEMLKPFAEVFTRFDIKFPLTHVQFHSNRGQGTRVAQKTVRFGKLKDHARQINRRKVRFFFKFLLFCLFCFVFFFALFVAVVDLPCVFFNSVCYKL